MFIRCNKRGFIIDGSYVRVGETREISDETLSSIEHLVICGWITVSQADPDAKRKARKASKAATTPPTKRARTTAGEYIPDDPDTKDTNEAWEGGKSPSETAGLKKVELISLAKKMEIALSGSETKAVLIDKIEKAGGE